MNHRTIAKYLLGGWLAWCATRSVAPAAGAGNEAVMALLDNQAYAVLVVDTDHANIQATLDKALEWMSLANPDLSATAGITNEVAATRAVMEKWREDFRQAGGRKVYALANAQDGLQFVLAIPLAKEGNPKALEALLEPLLKNSPFATFDKQVKGECLLLGKTEVLARLISAKPAPRTDLAQALEAMADCGLGLAVAPVPDQKRVIQEMLPQIQMGAAQIPTAALFKALNSAALEIGFPPETGLKLTALTASEADARELQATVGKVLKSVSSLVDDPSAKSVIEALLSNTTIRVDQNRLTYTLEKTTLDQLVVAQLLPALAAAKGKAQAIHKMNNAKQILLGCVMFENDNKKWPDNLKLLTAKGSYLGSPDVLKTPDHPEREAGFEYLMPGKNHAKYPAAQHIVIHEIFGAWPDAGLCIGFMDGHAEIMRDKSRFDKLLSETKERNRSE